jgi:hypothetical protein
MNFAYVVAYGDWLYFPREPYEIEFADGDPVRSFEMQINL